MCQFAARYMLRYRCLFSPDLYLYRVLLALSHCRDAHPLPSTLLRSM